MSYFSFSNSTANGLFVGIKILFVYLFVHFYLLDINLRPSEHRQQEAKYESQLCTLHAGNECVVLKCNGSF
jgi:hypothetical protein